jgi:plasmid stability protein
MTSITIRRLPEGTKEKLRLRAVRSGQSLESYARQVLRAAAEEKEAEAPNLAELAQACFGPKRGLDLPLPTRGKNRPPVRFD